jgi:hypothetical protein
MYFLQKALELAVEFTIFFFCVHLDPCVDELYVGFFSLLSTD